MDENTVRPRVLMVDDDQFVTVAYKDGLEKAGYQVTVAHDGEDALAQLAVSRPDLVLLDIIMPKLDGFEVLKAMQADSALAAIPVVVLTNLSQPSDEEVAKSYGARDFITKADNSLNDVVARLHNVLAA